MIDGARALGWRLRRHALESERAADATDAIRRVVALRGWPADSAELAVAVRSARPRLGALDEALETGELIRSYAFRGGSYVMAPEAAMPVLVARTATRVWESDRYQRQGGFAIDDWQPLRGAVADALGAGPLTRREIAARLERMPALAHLASAARSGAGSDALYKPLHWWGDICFGPEREGQSTFRLLHGSAGWPGEPDLDEAGRQACRDYLRAYAPATPANVAYWLADGLSVPKRRLEGWLHDLGDEVATVEVDGEPMLVLADDVDGLLEAEATDPVVLLPGFDPWVMGPGTADARIVPPQRRALATKGANLVLHSGVVAGTWKQRGGELRVGWFEERGPAPAAALESAAEAIAGIRDEPLSVAVMLA